MDDASLLPCPEFTIGELPAATNDNFQQKKIQNFEKIYLKKKSILYFEKYIYIGEIQKKCQNKE